MAKKIPVVVEEFNWIKNALDESSLVAITDKYGTITYANKKFCEVSKYSKEELLGKNHRILKSGFHPPSFFTTMWQTISQGKIWRAEIKNKAKDGTYYWVKTIILPILDKDGKPNRYVSIRTEITKQKDLEKRLKDAIKFISETQLHRNVYEKSPDLFRTTNFDGIIMDCNKSYAEHFGYSKDEVIGSSIFDFVDEENINRMRKIFEEWKKTGNVINKEIILKKKDGNTFPAILSATNLYNDKNEFVGSNTIIKDISEIYEARKKIDENKEKMQRQLEVIKKLTKTKDEFTSMITHELKTPLVPIISFVDLLLSKRFGAINEEQKKRLEIVKSNAHTLESIVSDFFDIMNIELHQLKLNKRVYDLSEIIKNVVTNMGPAAEKRNISITTDLQENISCFCDKNRMIQVLTNLIINAIEHSKSNGNIHIKLDSDNSYAHTVVKDDGEGIPIDQLEKIFGKFYQADTSLAREHGGGGLGLAVCNGIIEGHNGKIWAESEGKDMGSEIHILLSLTKRS